MSSPKRVYPNVQLVLSGGFQVLFRRKGKMIVGGTFQTIGEAIARKLELEAELSGEYRPMYGPPTEIEYLCQHFHYDAESGKFSYRNSARGRMAGAAAGSKSESGYCVLRAGRKSYLAHRVAFAMHYGRWPSGDLDHINRVRDDNRICNLRETDKTKNNWNRGRRKDSKGPVGVYPMSRGAWGAHIVVNYHRIRLGRFATQQEASEAYETARKKLHAHS